MEHNKIISLLEQALKAVNPFNAVKNCCEIQNGILSVKSKSCTLFSNAVSEYKNIYVVGCGKAVTPMFSALHSICNPYITQGILVTKYDHTDEHQFHSIELIQAAHPIPDQNGLLGANKTKEMLQKANEHDLVVALLSGGGSALWPLGVENVILSDLKRTNQVLLESGASIHEVNTIRKHISQLQGGKAALLAYPATVIVFVISDVIGDNLDTIASGPFFPDSTTFTDAVSIIKKYRIEKKMPQSVLSYILEGVQEKHPETPKKNAICFENVFSVLTATNKIALDAVYQYALSIGYDCFLITTPVQGEARLAACKFYDSIKEILQNRKSIKPLCIISGGETTVTLGEKYGKGGRNQEFALAVAFCIHGQENITILSCGTDGTDGPTDAAGAIVDGTFIEKCESLCLDAKSYLDNHDSYSLFEKTGNLIKTGPTLTNVMDIQIAIIE